MRSRRPLLATLALLVPLSASCSGGDGKLRVVSFPRGRLVIDGRTTTELTPVADRAIPSGSHEIGVVAEGFRFETQRVTVRSGKTSHLYFRARSPDGDATPEQICRTGRTDHCIARVEEALRSGDTVGGRRLAQIALAREQHEGYAIMLRQIITRLGGDAGPTPTPDE